MTAHAFIAIQHPDGFVNSSYIHQYGEPDVLGRKLVDNFRYYKHANDIVHAGYQQEIGFPFFPYDSSTVFSFTTIRKYRETAVALNSGYIYYYDSNDQIWYLLFGKDVWGGVETYLEDIDEGKSTFSPFCGKKC